MDLVNGSSTETQRQKRSRVVLSCGPCRASKLKCDRQSPCGQCTKKECADLCQYAPKPEGKKRAERRSRNMAERLKRLEGMVRGMMDEGDDAVQQNLPEKALSEGTGIQNGNITTPYVTGRLAGGYHGTYFGATHCMAMLEDIEDLKGYFGNEGNTSEDDEWHTERQTPDLLLSGRPPLSREDILSELPSRPVADRLIARYFASMAPSQHIVHRPAFTREYAAFWKNPDTVHFHWISQLFMMLCMGVHYNSFTAPHELEGDSPVPPRDRMRNWRNCASQCLVLGKFNQPNMMTIRAFVLFAESDFVHNRAAQMDCYILSGVLMRLMFKLGLHRDPGKLANISPYEGEMRRRIWNMAIQLETLVSFHMGLPSSFNSIESDTEVPRNLKDEDFDENITELPPARPDSEWTSITYPTHKTRIIRVFAKVASQSHSLTPPSYADMQRLDRELDDVWARVPSFMKIRPLSDCVGDPSSLLIQRFGLSALYCKTLCVLHRRYLAESVPQRQHDASRQKCLDAALTLLHNQAAIWEASQPGYHLADQGWFITSLAVHDYLLANMVIYLTIQNEHYENPDSVHNWTGAQQPALSKRELRNMMRRSHKIWSLVAEDAPDLKKTAETLALMLARLGESVDERPEAGGSTVSSVPQTVDSGQFSMTNSSGGHQASSIEYGSNTGDLSFADFNDLSTNVKSFSMQARAMDAMTSAFPAMSGADLDMSSLELDSLMGVPASNMDWRFLDVSMAHSHTAGSNVNGPGTVWTERAPLEQLGMAMPSFWGSSLDDEQNGHMNAQ